MHMSTTTGQWYQTNFDLSYYTYEHHVTIDGMARCMLLESKIDEEWWEAARDMEEYIYYRAVNGHSEVSLLIQLYGTRDSLSHLRIFECRVIPIYH